MKYCTCISTGQLLDYLYPLKSDHGPNDEFSGKRRALARQPGRQTLVTQRAVTAHISPRPYPLPLEISRHAEACALVLQGNAKGTDEASVEELAAVAPVASLITISAP